MKAEMKAVMVVDDQPAFRKAAVVVIDAIDSMYVVAEAADVDTALAYAVREPRPDLAIVDLHLESALGTDLCRDLLRVRPELTIVLVSTTADEDLPSGVYTCGAHGFIAKSRFGPTTLSEAVASVVNHTDTPKTADVGSSLHLR